MYCLTLTSLSFTPAQPYYRPGTTAENGVILTAQVVLTLVAVLPSMKGNNRARVNIAKTNAIR